MAVNPKYITYPIATDARSLMAKAFNYLKAKIPGWQPSEGQLDTWLIEAISGEAADIGTLASEVPKSIYRDFGAKRFGIAPIEASQATTTAVVNISDVLGHVIPAGMQVGIYDPSGVLQPFTVVSEVQVPGGITTATVTLLAVIPGSAASGIGSNGGQVTLIDTVSWISSVTQNTVTNGGVDAESDDDYLNRLSLKLQTITPTPILAKDFAILARDVAGVQRATAVDGYNTVDQSYGNERMVTVIALDSLGVGIQSQTKTDLATYLENLRELNFVVNISDPTLNHILINTQFTTLPGYSNTDVETRVTSAINTYFDPATWAIADTDNPTTPTTWINANTIYYLELATLINNVSGVALVTLLTLGLASTTPTSQDLTMTGLAPIPVIDTLSVMAI